MIDEKELKKALEIDPLIPEKVKIGQYIQLRKDVEVLSKDAMVGRPLHVRIILRRASVFLVTGMDGENIRINCCDFLVPLSSVRIASNEQYRENTRRKSCLIISSQLGFKSEREERFEFTDRNETEYSKHQTNIELWK